MQELPWERRRRIGGMLASGGAQNLALGAIVGTLTSLPLAHDFELILAAIPFLAAVGGISGAAGQWLTPTKTVFVPLALALVSVLLTGQLGLFAFMFAWPTLVCGALVLGGVIAIANDRARHRAAIAALSREE